MFDFERPPTRDQAQARQIGTGLAVLVISLLLVAMVPSRAGLAPLKRSGLHLLIEWGPAIVLAAALRLGVGTPATAAALVAAAVGAGAGWATGHIAFAVAGALVGCVLFVSIKVADQWEKFVVLRFGRFHALRGPGIFFIVPVVDRVAAVIDERVRTTAVHSEAALTRDTMRVNVDAVIFWVVWDAQKAAFEVQDFDRAVALVAQTSLLESIGRQDLGAMIADRAALRTDLQRALQEKTTAWGLTVQSVEIRDVRLPSDLQDVMSRQAQAERERQARGILATSEVELAGQFAEASVAYKNDPTALHLRAMNMLYEAIKEKGTMVVVPVSALRRRARAGRRLHHRVGGNSCIG